MRQNSATWNPSFLGSSNESIAYKRLGRFRSACTVVRGQSDSRTAGAVWDVSVQDAVPSKVTPREPDSRYNHDFIEKDWPQQQQGVLRTDEHSLDHRV